MLYKTELTKENVLKAIDFLVENTSMESSLDGKPTFRLIVHESQSKNAREICKAINDERGDIAISKVALDWSWDFQLDQDEESEFQYGWFLHSL